MSVSIIGQIPEGVKYAICGMQQCRLVLAYHDSDATTNRDPRDQTWTKTITCPCCKMGVIVATESNKKEKQLRYET